MTVSRALNTPQLVRPKTVEKVMQAVQATGYIPNALAGGLASRRSKLVAVVVPQINNNMFVDTIQALSDTLAARGYHMLLCVAGIVLLEFSLDGRLSWGEPSMGRDYALMAVLCAAMFAVPASLLRRVCGGSCARRMSGRARV